MRILVFLSVLAFAFAVSVPIAQARGVAHSPRGVAHSIHKASASLVLNCWSCKVPRGHEP